MSMWRSIRLELGRTNQFPAGSVSRGYLIRLPIGDTDLVDETAFEQNPDRATAQRFWSTEPDEAGFVQRSDGGWTIRCNGTMARQLQLDGRPIRLGQQVPVADADGDVLPFRIASIR